MSIEPSTVFVSYSHRDEAWKDRLVKHLEVLQFEGAVDVWDDRRIGAGDDWRPEIEQAIARAAVAVLIVSPDFLTSRFIREQELTRILERRSRQALRVVPLIARPCAWRVVAALQGIQARPLDGRALSGGNDHQIDTDLSNLALEIRGFLTATAHEGPEPPRAAAKTEGTLDHAAEVAAGRHPVRGHQGGVRRQRILLFLWLCLPSGVAALLVLGATMWRVPTRVSIDVFTRRLAFVVSGRDRPSLLNANRQFSELTIERCGTVSFQAEEFELGTHSAPRRGSDHYAGPVRLNCRDPDAKITFASRSGRPTEHAIQDRSQLPPVGALDRLPLSEGASVVVDVVKSPRTVFTMDVSTRQRFDLAIHGPFFLTADLVHEEAPSGSSAPLTMHRVRVPESNRLVHVDGTERGMVLIVAPVMDHADEFFNSDLRLPVAEVQFLDEAVNEGVLTSPFVRDGTLTYPDYPTISPLAVPHTQFFVAARTSGMEITRIAVPPEAIGLGVTMEGILEEGRIGLPATSTENGTDGRWKDPRLTVYQTLRYGPRRGIVAGIVVWVFATTAVCYERWKSLVA